MTVYIITKQPFPNGMAGTNRVTCYAQAIISQGIQCKVIIFTRTEIYDKQPKNSQSSGNFEGIEYTYIGKTPIRNRFALIRKYFDFHDKVGLLFYLWKNLKKNDIVISYADRDVELINIVIRTTHLKRAKFIRDLCELPYGTGIETEKTTKKRKIVFNKIFPKCDGIIAISDSLLSLAKKYTNKNCKLIKIPILVDFEKYKLPDNSQSHPFPYIFHSGTLYEQKDGILGMLEAFGKAVYKLKMPIQFILTRNLDKSPHKEQINEIINKYEIKDKVLFTGYLNNEDLKDYLSKASLVIINKYPNQQNAYCFSTKLGEYLAAGKPVIITKVGEAINWLKGGESAYIIDPNDTDLLAQTIIRAFNDPIKRKEIGKNGQKLCKESFDYRNYGAIFSQFFSQLTL